MSDSPIQKYIHQQFTVYVQCTVYTVHWHVDVVQVPHHKAYVKMKTELMNCTTDSPQWFKIFVLDKTAVFAR